MRAMFFSKKVEPPLELPVVETWGMPGLDGHEASFFVMMICILATLRWSSTFASYTGERTLNMQALNRAIATKEILWAYLNAGLLEPLLTIAGSEEITEKQLIVNCLQLFGLMSWIYLIFDAFDTSDVQQAYVYRKLQKQRKADAADLPWLTITNIKQKRRSGVMNDLSGSATRDAALWFMLSGIFAACAGIVSHREAAHSYAVVGLWAVLHHQSRRATAWGAGYLQTLFSPSAALMPLEYCILLTDVESIEDLDALAEWRGFVADETGVSLLIEA